MLPCKYFSSIERGFFFPCPAHKLVFLSLGRITAVALYNMFQIKKIYFILGTISIKKKIHLCLWIWKLLSLWKTCFVIDLGYDRRSEGSNRPYHRSVEKIMSNSTYVFGFLRNCNLKNVSLYIWNIIKILLLLSNENFIWSRLGVHKECHSPIKIYAIMYVLPTLNKNILRKCK